MHLDSKLFIETNFRIGLFLDIGWSCDIFTSHNFCVMLIEQLINLGKVRTENLKFRTDLRDRVMDGWSVTQ